MQLDEALLIQYALGILDRPESLIVDEALSTSAISRKQFYEIQETLNTMALAETPLQPDPRLREHVLAAIEPSNRFAGFTTRFAELFDLGEQEAGRLFAKIDETTTDEWTSSLLLPGVRFLEFQGGPRVSAAHCGLISVKPDTFFPRHRHRGDEWVLVLQGRALDNRGSLLQPGDLLFAEPGSEHAFLTPGPEPFVFAVLLSKDNKWLILPSLLDRIFGKYRFPDRRSLSG
ncbi:MAG: cupin domain-containing protein [Methylococcaceae bacterium]|nr:cupin domain-containing protein [Methylococcaceae bacterium]